LAFIQQRIGEQEIEKKGESMMREENAIEENCSKNIVTVTAWPLCVM